MASTNPPLDAHEQRRRPARRRGQPTVDDVAAAAGVSIATVSRSFQGSPLVRERTRLKVLEAARQIGFEPSRVAQALAMGSSTLVGMVVPDAGHVFFARALKGAQDVLKQAGYQVLLMNSENDPALEAEALRTLLAHRVSGILLATSGGFERCEVPVVFFDQVLRDAGSGQVLLANREGTDLLVEHLLGHGHTRIAYVGGPPGRTSADERREAFQAALARRWLAVPPEYVRVGDVEWSEASGEREAAAVFALDPAPTAILAANDRLAVGAIRAARAAGRRIPEDLALVCFDDPDWADVVDPALTAIRNPSRALGERAAELLLEQLTMPGSARELRVPVELVVRRSCGCRASDAAAQQAV